MGVNNPAGRLSKLIKDADEAVARVNEKCPAHTILAHMLSVPVDNHSAVFQCFGRFLEMPALISSRILALPSLTEAKGLAYLNWTGPFLKGFNGASLDSPWPKITAHVDAAILAAIEVCDDKLSTESPEKDIAADELSHLQDEVSELIREIAESQIEVTLKEYMLKHLKMVEAAINDYRFFGIEAFYTVVGSTGVSTALDPSIFERVKASPVGSKFWDVMGKILTFVRIMAGLTQLATDVGLFLPEPDVPGQLSVAPEPAPEAVPQVNTSLDTGDGGESPAR